MVCNKALEYLTIKYLSYFYFNVSALRVNEILTPNPRNSVKKNSKLLHKMVQKKSEVYCRIEYTHIVRLYGGPKGDMRAVNKNSWKEASVSIETSAKLIN